MTHTITIEGLTEEEFNRITDLLKGRKHNGVIFPDYSKAEEEAQKYVNFKKNDIRPSEIGLFLMGYRWCIEETIIE